MNRINIKKIVIVFLFSILFVLSSCNTKDLFALENINDAKEKYIGGEKFVICNKGFFNGEEIYILRNQSIGQSLGIVIKTRFNKLIVFDGGRIQDGELLFALIKELGGEVHSWFLSHVHDDHIGALYYIFEKHKEDVLINHIYYSFPDYNWLYSVVGDEADGIKIFEDGLTKYVKYIGESNPKYKVNVYNKVKSKESHNIDKVEVIVMNSKYQIDKNSINNSSIAYKVNIDNKSIMFLGDMGKEAGDKLLEDATIPLKSDFVVMAHHGQKGVGKKVYETINPSYCIWCTTKDIYNNKYGIFETNKTKAWLNDLDVKEHFVTLDNSLILK